MWLTWDRILKVFFIYIILVGTFALYRFFYANMFDTDDFQSIAVVGLEILAIVVPILLYFYKHSIKKEDLDDFKRLYAVMKERAAKMKDEELNSHLDSLTESRLGVMFREKKR